MILQAALELFTARGYDGCGVQEICEAAGISKPTLYYYFGSKTGLLEALFAAHHPLFAAEVAQAARYTHDLPADLERVMRAFFDFASQNPRYYRLLLGLYFAPPQSEAHQRALAWIQPQNQALVGLFQQAEADHGNMRGKSAYLAASFLGQIHTCISLAINGFARLDDALMYQALRHFQYGIYT